MSERSKGDTSSSMSASATTARVVKNPLLSASVTGLTFDDFQNKPLLLPAAPPIIHPAPIPSSRESTPLVTVGKSSDIDSEDLSEINLNDISGTSSTTHADKSDENCNTLLEPSSQSDNSILSQAASSFSQLPSVASSVFSTFSKKFSSASLRDDVNSNTVPQLDIQPFASEFPSQPPLSLPPPPSGFGNQEQECSGSHTDNQAKAPIEPPTFYSPSEVPTIPSGTSGPPTALGQNTYRISAKKKIYAPIPGLSSHHTDQNFPPTATTTTFLPPIGFETTSLPVYGEQAHNKPEEKKGGLFSLSSFVPAVPNVLQNLSGLVQSATGSLAQKTQGPTQEQPVDSLTTFQVDARGQDPPSHYPSPSQTNFFDPNQVPPQANIYQAPPPVNFFAPETAIHSQAPSATGLFPSLPPQSEVAAAIFAPFASNPQPSAPPLPPSSVSGGYPQELLPEVNSTSESSQSVPPPPTKPPSSAPSSTSFRLQKGTRLYKSPFVAASPDYQHHAGYGYPPAPQNIIPLNQQPTEIFGHFNPLQENPLLTQNPVIQPTVAEKTSTSPILEPTSAPQIIPENLSQDIVPKLTVFNPIQTISQENNISNQSLLPTLSISSGLINDKPAEEAAANPEEIRGEDTEIGDLQKEEASVIEPLNVPDTDEIKEQLLKPNQFLPQVPSSLQIQPTLLPPPPIIASGFETQSKETANFPPPPPQHSLQNKPNSNPYRRGLQSHQPPLAPPTSLSAIFRPSDQDLHPTKPVTPDSVNTFFEGQPPSVANFFTDPTTSDVFSYQPKVTSSTSTQEVSTESADLILPAPGDFSIKEPSGEPQLANNPTSFPPPQESGSSISETLTTAEAKSSPATSIASGVPPLLTTSVEKEKNCSPQLQTIHKTPDNTSIEATSSGEPEKTTAAPAFGISSFFPAAGETETNPNPFKIPEIAAQRSYPPTNLVNFFQTDTQPPIAFAVEQSKASELKESNPPSQATAAVLPARAKIASPLNPPENPQPQQSVPNLISTFFEPESVAPSVQQQSLPDPTSFFDSFGQVPTVGVDPAPPEDPNSLRIQNFFNNPPPKDLDSVGDLNYDLVGSGLSVKNLQTRSLTPASNLAEPPSSSCSEFSELNSSLSAANRQARLPAEDSAKVSPEEESIFETDNQELPEEILNEIKMANSASGAAFQANVAYTPAVKHWFYKRKEVAKYVWTPFSYYDSALLEDAFLQRDDGRNLVAVEGGRYDVNIAERVKAPVYWEGDPIEVKRCSWFYKGSDSKYVPYEEEVADLLEEEYRKASETCEWHKKIPISSSDTVVFHGPTVIVQFQQQQQVDSWGGTTQTKSRPRVVKRDLDDFTIEEGESHRVDHLLFMIHGIGSACDLKMRPLEEVVDEFRGIALQLVQSHYKNSVENGFVGRVEVLPVSWHGELHSDELGIDEKLKSITLESIPKLRNFTNDTLLDILFYTSPMFCQRIMNTITASMNSVYVKYRQRHPDFQGGVSLAGHSLGSLILFDLLCHQRPLKDCEDQNMENPDEYTPGFPVDSNQLNADADKHISYKMGPAGTGQPFISYPQLIFQPKKFFALGSPIGMFVTIRGIDKLGLDFRLPTCSGFYNIFHPYDPVAYRLEALVNPDMTGIPPVLIPHHKGRKRMHLEFKETMTRVGADLKQRFFETFKTTFDSVSFLAPKSKNESKEIEKEVDKVLKLQSQQEQHSDLGPSTSRPRTDSNSTNQSDNEIIEVDFPLGKLNDSKRIDYVLQEAPLEFFNEYLFALSSHVCYWESEDTILFVMKEIYNGIGYSPDSQVPQQTMTIERPSSSAGGATQPSS